MILVDSSVWIEAFRRRGDEAAELERLLGAGNVLLAAPVRLEILAGASKRDRKRLRSILSALPIAMADETAWRMLDEWVDAASEEGERFGFADLLIGAIAAQWRASVWSLDSDFARMERLGFVSRHLPRR